MAPQKRHVVSYFFVIIASMIISSSVALPYYYDILGDGILDDVFAAFKGIPSSSSSASMVAKTFNVDDYGAKGDGNDDSEAFMKAWEEACAEAGATLLVPKSKTYGLKPVTFSGPCKGNLWMQVLGKLVAPGDRSAYKKDRRHWILFQNLQRFTVDGGRTGTFHGRGKIWWQHSCKINSSLPCTDAPTAVTFYKTNHTAIKNLKIQDSPQIHMRIEKCEDVTVSDVTVTAPKDSPNTDGIHITSTRNIIVKSSNIGTGDDCISIVSGSQNVKAQDITCGPGHGISIGSLGSDQSKAYVSGVTVDGAKFSGSTNGVRIKTYQGGSGTANNIKFQNINMDNVKNPIIINQYYCDQEEPCKEQSKAVQLSGITYKNIHGTSASKIAINFNCSRSHHCQKVVLQNINLELQGGGAAKAVCNNVDLEEIRNVSPRCSKSQSSSFSAI